jgi:hypothetical protein
VKALLLFSLLSVATLHAQNEGLWEGYDGEWSHASRQLLALAQATPPQKFAWRPAPGVRSIGEVYMHIAIANFYLLSIIRFSGRVPHGPEFPVGSRGFRKLHAPFL